MYPKTIRLSNGVEVVVRSRDEAQALLDHTEVLKRIRGNSDARSVEAIFKNREYFESCSREVGNPGIETKEKPPGGAEGFFSGLKKKWFGGGPESSVKSWRVESMADEEPSDASVGRVGDESDAGFSALEISPEIGGHPKGEAGRGSHECPAGREAGKYLNIILAGGLAEKPGFEGYLSEPGADLPGLTGQLALKALVREYLLNEKFHHSSAAIPDIGQTVGPAHGPDVKTRQQLDSAADPLPVRVQLQVDALNWKAAADNPASLELNRALGSEFPDLTANREFVERNYRQNWSDVQMDAARRHDQQLHQELQRAHEAVHCSESAADEGHSHENRSRDASGESDRSGTGSGDVADRSCQLSDETQAGVESAHSSRASASEAISTRDRADLADEGAAQPQTGAHTSEDGASHSTATARVGETQSGFSGGAAQQSELSAIQTQGAESSAGKADQPAESAQNSQHKAKEAFSGSPSSPQSSKDGAGAGAISTQDSRSGVQNAESEAQLSEENARNADQSATASSDAADLSQPSSIISESASPQSTGSALYSESDAYGSDESAGFRDVAPGSSGREAEQSSELVEPIHGVCEEKIQKIQDHHGHKDEEFSDTQEIQDNSQSELDQTGAIVNPAGEATQSVADSTIQAESSGDSSLESGTAMLAAVDSQRGADEAHVLARSAAEEATHERALAESARMESEALLEEIRQLKAEVRMELAQAREARQAAQEALQEARRFRDQSQDSAQDAKCYAEDALSYARDASSSASDASSSASEARRVAERAGQSGGTDSQPQNIDSSHLHGGKDE